MTTDTLTSKRSRLIGAALIVLIAAGALALWLRARHFETTDDAQVDGHLHAISARTTGTILSINPDVQNNHYVEAGTLLMELDPHQLLERAAGIAQSAWARAAGSTALQARRSATSPSRTRDRTRPHRTWRSKKPT
jgi:membrane fusion protein (multidrug efflux system)